MVDEEIIDHLKTELPEGIAAYFISSVAMQGITELKDALWAVLNK
jgi:GTP-binding protein